MTNEKLARATEINNELLQIDAGLRQMDAAGFISFRNFHVHKSEHPELFMKLRVTATEYMRERLAKLKSEYADL